MLPIDNVGQSQIQTQMPKKRNIASDSSSKIIHTNISSSDLSPVGLLIPEYSHVTQEFPSKHPY